MTTTLSPRTARPVRRSGSGPGGSPARRRRTRSAVLFLAPFGVLFAAMMLAPIAYAVYESFFEVRRSGLGLGPSTTAFAGLSHYSEALRDSAFLASLLRVFLIGLVQVPVMLGLALLLALLIDSRAARFKRTFQLVYFLPFALPGAIAAIMWSYLYMPSISPVTAALESVGISLDPLSDTLVPVSIGNMLTWAWTGYNMLIIHSALKAIPAELSEAARLDGCSGWRLAWHVKIPLVRPALVLTAVFSIIGTAQLYTEPEILRRVAGSITGTYTPILATQYATNLNDYHFAAAESVVLALLTFVLSFGFLKYTQRKGMGS
ncbi:sugar ABC transporter permease [Streptomyces sp. NPDC051940]|uniref:carbohydrate ABC transporter permease n=1 Tax=Streptomyces sp. NPDC051940 TaxID=3155675 RepID=UPI00344654E5